MFPVSVVDAALFFSHLATSQVSASVTESSYCALKWAHDFAGVPNPMSSTFVKNMVEGAKRQNAKPTSKKSPISKVSELLVWCFLPSVAIKQTIIHKRILVQRGKTAAQTAKQ